MKLDVVMNSCPADVSYAPYAVRKLMDGVWMIEDGTPTRSCIYVVEGSDAAVVIDTGTPCGGDLFALVRKLTPLPWKLIITHGHPDHAAFLDQVDAFYMSERDLELLLSFDPQSAGCVSHLHAIDGTTTFDLGGGVVLYTIDAPGHSPGSVLFADPYHGLVFTGDAFGSGEGVWMQVPGALDMSAYRESILQALDILDRVFGEREYTLLPGHAYQLFIGVPGYQPNPPCKQMLVDMAELCARAINGTAEIVETKPDDTAFTDERVLRIVYERASQVCIRSRFR